MSPHCLCFLLKLKQAVKNSSIAFVIDRESKTVHAVDPYRGHFLLKENTIQWDFDRLDIYMEALLEWDYIKAVDAEKEIYMLKEKGVHPIWYLFWKYAAPALLGGLSGWIFAHI